MKTLRKPPKIRFCAIRNVPNKVAYRLARLSLGRNGIMREWLGKESNGYTSYLYRPCRKNCNGCQKCDFIGWAALVPHDYTFPKRPVIGVYIKSKYRRRGHGEKLVKSVLGRAMRYMPKNKRVVAADYRYSKYGKIFRKMGYGFASM